MQTLMIVENAGEERIVRALFDDVTKTLAKGKDYTEVGCYCEEDEEFSTFTTDGVSIPYGAIVYALRPVKTEQGTWESVWDVYNFGSFGGFRKIEDVRGGVSGLANLPPSMFPFVC